MGKIEFVSHLVFHFVSLILEITKLKTKFLHFYVTGALFSFVCELKFCFLGEVFLAVLTQWLSCWSFHSTSHAWSAGWSFLWQIFLHCSYSNHLGLLITDGLCLLFSVVCGFALATSASMQWPALPSYQILLSN